MIRPPARHPNTRIPLGIAGRVAVESRILQDGGGIFTDDFFKPGRDLDGDTIGTPTVGQVEIKSD